MSFTIRRQRPYPDDDDDASYAYILSTSIIISEYRYNRRIDFNSTDKTLCLLSASLQPLDLLLCTPFWYLVWIIYLSIYYIYIRNL